MAFSDGDDLARACAAQMADLLDRAIRQRGVATLVLAGGSTPAPMFRELAKADLDWSRVIILQVDERFVPPDSPRSNARLIRETLLTGPAAAASTRLATRRETVTLDWMVPRDLDLLGGMALRVWLQTDRSQDVHLFAGVRKFHDGREVTFEGSFGFGGDMVTHGWQRPAFRDLDSQLSSRWQPVHTFAREQPLAPGEIVPVDVALLPQATRFRAGDIVRLELRGDWPRPRNPITGQFPSGYCPSAKGHLIVHSGNGHDSHLLVGSRPI